MLENNHVQLIPRIHLTASPKAYRIRIEGSCSQTDADDALQLFGGLCQRIVYERIASRQTQNPFSEGYHV